MPRSWIVIVILLCAGSGLANPSVSVVVDRDAALAQLSTLRAALSTLRLQIAQQTNLLQLVDGAQRSADALQRQVAGAPPTSPPYAAPAPPSTAALPSHPTAIAPARLRNLITLLKQEAFPDGKLRVLSQAATTNFFSVIQLIDILKLFSFPDDKVKAVAIVVPRLIDRQNSFQLYSAFTFPSDKERVRQVLESPGGYLAPTAPSVPTTPGP